MNPTFKNADELLPAVIQHEYTGQVLMLGYMNREAYQKTQSSGLVTFFSRSKNRLWTKGETSGNFLKVTRILTDCDADTILIKAVPEGPVCHKGTTSCFGEETAKGFIYQLEKIISERASSGNDSSYTRRLMSHGISKAAQKVGEEAVETVIEALKNDKEALKNETADLLYHLLILLHMNGLTFRDVEAVLKARQK